MQGYSDALPTAGGVDRFFAALRNLHTSPYLASDAKTTVDTIRTIVGRSEAKAVVAGGLALPARMLVESALRGTKHRFVEELGPSEAVETIAKADVGISWARHAVAREGALVEVAFDDSVKLVSALPRVSVFLASERDLLPDLASAVAQVAQIIRSSGEKKPVVSFISGPSKTADIELRLLYGVHGPHELHVILLDWM
ncbi:MAG: lactate utilization protein [Nitrososphaerales archaeon]